MMSMLDEIARSNSKVATIETIGKSFEGRDLKVIKISSGSSSGKKKIWIDAGLHAREWIGPSTAMYFINKVNIEMVSLDIQFQLLLIVAIFIQLLSLFSW